MAYDETPTATTLAGQLPVLVALAGLAVSHPHLPGAYFTISDVMPTELGVQLDSPGQVEAWREALNVPAEQVILRTRDDRSALKFEATAYGMQFRVYAVYDPAEQAGEVADDAVLAP
ncbi:hypothetical protein ACFUTV_43300 [Streptomyces sp. NPDC057298]|uniref:hypothetical protein n=1 Tax=Streptomyces sp. NPDC057298 TaxID=3346091 RepID=UPI00362ACE76